MIVKSGSWLAFAAVIWLGSCRTAWPASPSWSKLAVFKRLEADPNEIYPISDANGPWMVMATTFTGEGAEDQARQLIYELRKQYKLPAYSYQKKFEFSKPVRGLGLTPRGEQPLMRYQQGKDVVEIAVLVGDYPAVDDPEAQKVLKRLKVAEPKSLSVEPGKESSQALSAFRTLQKQAKLEQLKQGLASKDTDDLKRGPMANAFVITNPLLPKEYFVPDGIDNFVLDMNKGVSHSLLDCPGRYTVKVATFTGHAVIIDKKRQEAIENGHLPKSYLETAAANAHTLAEALVKKGYTAFEYHDRSSSIVTVGSFDSVGSRREDGKIEINPAIHTIMLTFGAETTVEPGKMPEVGKAKKLAGIPFDVQPMPVEVPRRNVSNAYSRTAGVR
jgi:hypothetical protein